MADGQGYRSYQHVERLGAAEVDGILDGRVWVFPKIDGTNAVLWWDESSGLCAGSRRLEMSADRDNHGFREAMLGSAEIADLVRSRPSWVFYGEWLVPHTLKCYRAASWRRFYVFDVWDRDERRYLEHPAYSDVVSGTIDVVPPLATIDHPSQEQLLRLLESNTYLIADGAGPGEGLVLKNYAFWSKFGRQTWAKMVRNEFKERNREAFGHAEKSGPRSVEVDAVRRFLTPEMIRKTYDRLPRGGRSVIPRLLQTVFHDFVVEETWAILKQHRNPTIDFRKVRRLVVARVKEVLPEVFTGVPRTDEGTASGRREAPEGIASGRATTCRSV